MEEDLLRITPNKDKARSIFKMVEITLEMIRQIDKSKFPSNIAKEYYEVTRELISIILLLDGYKTIGEGAHKRQIEYLEANYRDFSKYEIAFIDLSIGKVGGSEVAKISKQYNPDAKVICICGYEVKFEDFDACLSKPLSLEKTLSALHQLID